MKIDKNVPLAPTKGEHKDSPMKKYKDMLHMDVGDSFFVGDTTAVRRVRYVMQKLSKTKNHTRKKFTIRRDSKGGETYRCWRIK